MKFTGCLRKIASGALFFLLPIAWPSCGQAQDQAKDQPQSQAKPQSQQQTRQSPFTLKVNSDLVLTNVVVRDKKTGAVVTGLTAKDFSIQENGKPQEIISFDFENVDQAAPLNEATINGKNPNVILGTMNRAATSEELRNHRLIVMFFDITSMQPEDLERSVDAAQDFLKTKMQPADLVKVFASER